MQVLFEQGKSGLKLIKLKLNYQQGPLNSGKAMPNKRIWSQAEAKNANAVSKFWNVIYH